MKFLCFVRRYLNYFYTACGFFAALSLVGIAAVTAAQIVARLFNLNIPSSDDFTGYMVAWSTFMGLAYAMKNNDHIRVDIVISNLPKLTRRIILVIVNWFGTCIVGLLVYYAFKIVHESYTFNDMTIGQVAVPLWTVQMPYLIGIFAFVIAIIEKAIVSLVKEEDEKLAK